MSDARKTWEDIRASPALHLLGYFLGLAAVIVFLTHWVPDFEALLLPASSGGGITDFESALGSAGSGGANASGVRETIAIAFVSLFGALAVSAPVVWIYMVIMRQEGYERSFVRMLLILPIVVAGVVQVVRGDLALAFALAGIVAAVRFRTTVKDLQNAVFAFAAIGIGLASGTGSFLLAMALSVTVCFLAYAMWRMHLGDVEPSLELGHAGGPLSEALVPGESHRAVVIGDEDSVEPVHAEDLPELSSAIERLADYVRADALRKKKKYNTLMLVYTDDPDEAREVLEEILEDSTKRWVEIDTISREEDGLVALEFLLRLKKSVDVGEMVDRLGCGPDCVIKAVELKPIKGLRKRLT